MRLVWPPLGWTSSMVLLHGTALASPASTSVVVGVGSCREAQRESPRNWICRAGTTGIAIERHLPVPS